jgi:ribosome-associated toxin RatA of RatAB toxin-antitoxin module
MRKWPVLVFLLLLLTPLLFSGRANDARAAAVFSRSLSAAELAKIEAGEILLDSQKFSTPDGTTRGRALAVGFIRAGKDKLINTLLDYTSYPQFMPRMKKAEIYLTAGNVISVKFTIKVLVTVVYYLKHTIDRAGGSITWELDPSHKSDIRDTTGSWYFQPYKNGCIAYYAVTLDSGYAIPGWLEDYLTKRDLPAILRALRTRVGG